MSSQNEHIYTGTVLIGLAVAFGVLHVTIGTSVESTIFSLIIVGLFNLLKPTLDTSV